MKVDIIRKWEEQGWRCSKTKKSHIRLLHPDAAYPVIASGTPSDKRSIQNCEADMRRSIKMGLQRKTK